MVWATIYVYARSFTMVLYPQSIPPVPETTARGQYRLADQAIAVYRRWAQEERMALPQELAAQHRTAARP